MIEGTLNAWATAIGCDQQTLERRLVKAGCEWKRGGKIPASVALKAYFDNPKDRLLTAQAADVERDNLIADGKLCEWHLVEKYLNERLVSPFISAMDAAPSAIDREWVEKVLKPVVRAKLQPPK